MPWVKFPDGGRQFELDLDNEGDLVLSKDDEEPRFYLALNKSFPGGAHAFMSRKKAERLYKALGKLLKK